MSTARVDLVCEGGGVRGIGLVGAVDALAATGYEFPRVAGSNAGAVVASLVAAFLYLSGLQSGRESQWIAVGPRLLKTWNYADYLAACGGPHASS